MGKNRKLVAIDKQQQYIFVISTNWIEQFLIFLRKKHTQIHLASIQMMCEDEMHWIQ